MEKMAQGNESLNKKQSLPFQRWYHACCSFSIDFCASSSTCYIVIVVKLPSLMIICSFSFRFCISSSSSCCSAKASWECLEIAELSSGGLEMAIAAYHYWGELIYHLSGTDLLQTIFELRPSVLKSFPPHAAKMQQFLLLLVTGQHISLYQDMPLTL